MARIDISRGRTVNTEKLYLGKVLIFCEGYTEFNYFNYFSQIFNKDKFNDIEVKLQNAEGNAQTVLNAANSFYQEGTNANRYSHFETYLVFDCDDPPNIQNVITNMLNSENNYKLLLTNLLFETWLVMHFEEITTKMRKIDIYRKIKEHLELGVTDDYNSYKNSKGMIRKIIGDGSSIRNAINNAIKLESHYGDQNMTIEKNISMMDPYTTMHSIMEKISDALTKR